MERHCEDLPFDDRAHAYRRSGDIAATIATQHFGIDVDPLTRLRWRDMMSLLREVDTWADDTAVSSSEVIDNLADFSIFERRYPHLSPLALGTEVQGTMLRRTEHILRLGQLAAHATSLGRFVAFRALEGREAVQLFGDCATEHVESQSAFRKEFLPTLAALGAGATLWDSLIDGRSDFSTGKQRVLPDKEYYLALAGTMLHLARGNVRCLLHPGPIYYGGLKIADRIANRVRNGVPIYSNLHRFKQWTKSLR